MNILRTARNDSLILIFGYGVATVLASLLSLYSLIKNRRWPVILWLLSFFVPFFISGKFWYGGLYGRYSVLIALPLGIMYGLIKNKKAYYLFICVLFVSFLSTFLVYLKTPIPLIQNYLIDRAGIKEEDLLVLSDYQRPQIPLENGLYVNGVGDNKSEIEVKIKNALEIGKRVFITQQAVNFPYWQYDGQQIHIISKNNDGRAILNDFLDSHNIVGIASDIDFPLLSIYRIKKK